MSLFLVGSLAAKKKNVLLIIVDDLRADLEQFCTKEIHKPAIDKLSAEGVSFGRAYCQKALCVPSRQSFLTGLRPNKFGADFNDHFRRKLPQHLTLPQYFKQKGYKSISIGKVFHHRDPKSWSEPSWVPEPSAYYPIYGTKEGLEIQTSMVKKKKFFPKGNEWWAKGDKWVPGLIWEAPKVKDNDLTDGMLADYAINKLKEVKNTPFFIAVDFFRPHLPFIAPKKYFDLYPLSSIRLPDNESLPKDAPSIAAQTGGEWRSYHDIKSRGMPQTVTRKEYIRAYLASLAYVDAQIGRLLGSIEGENLKENTIVILMSDHGYHLFDNNSFGKSTNFEDATKVLLTVRAPQIQKARKTDAIVELVDLYPTVCELAGLKTTQTLDGKSFVDVLKGKEKGKEAAFSQYFRSGYQGLSVRTKRFRFTQWQKGSKTIEELYDFNLKDPEAKNVAEQSKYRSYLSDLREKLKQGF